jgi:hypothetical protein
VPIRMRPIKIIYMIAIQICISIKYQMKGSHNYRREKTGLGKREKTSPRSRKDFGNAFGTWVRSTLRVMPRN